MSTNANSVKQCLRNFFADVDQELRARQAFQRWNGSLKVCPSRVVMGSRDGKRAIEKLRQWLEMGR